MRRHLETLAENPASVQALIDAGRAALDMGDADAALSFFTRASQLASANPRVKLGLASAHARSGRPQNALSLFSQAQAMGIPLGEMVGERGLAYDLLGQPAAAQQDYVAALRYREDPEIRRRLALSLAITGQREAALRVIGGLVSLGDRATLRTRAFVLALSGDASGATEAARTSMPPGSAQAIAPFFQRLASLPAGQMAAAAHLGRFPSNSGFRSAASSRPASDPGALAFAGGGAAPNVALASRLPVAVPSADATRRRPGAPESADRYPRRSGVSRETRSLAAATSRPRADSDARRTIDRWELAGRGSPRALRDSTPAAAVPQQLAARPATAPIQQPPVPTVSVTTTPVVAAQIAPAITAPPATAAPIVAAAAVPLATGVPIPTGSAAFLLPHPHQPLRAAAGAVASPGLSEALTGGSLASAARIPEATPPAPSVDLASQSAALPPAVTPMPSAQAEPAAPNAVAATLAAWNGIAPAASPAPEAPQTEALAAPAVTAPAPEASPPAASPLRPAFAQVAAAVTALPVEDRPAAPTPAVRRSAPPATNASRAAATRATPARATAAAARPLANSRPPAQAHPTRIWVQVATAARASLPGELNRLRRIAPELLRSRTGFTAAGSGANARLLVGPFATPAEARTFVNRLKDEDISAYAWTSDSGQEVERLPAGR